MDLWLFDMQQIFLNISFVIKNTNKTFTSWMQHLNGWPPYLWRDSPVALARFYSLRLSLALGLVADGDITSCAAAVRLKAIIRPPRPASLSATCVHLAQWRPFRLVGRRANHGHQTKQSLPYLVIFELCWRSALTREDCSCLWRTISLSTWPVITWLKDSSDILLFGKL